VQADVRESDRIVGSRFVEGFPVWVRPEGGGVPLTAYDPLTLAMSTRALADGFDDRRFGRALGEHALQLCLSRHQGVDVHVMEAREHRRAFEVDDLVPLVR